MKSIGGNGALHEIADGVYAYLQTGSWGFSNAGLVADGGTSLLVDTLYDHRLTRRMLEEMRRTTPCANRIATVVNTHANGDHCWGNRLVADAKIISSRAAALEMKELSPKLMAILVGASRTITRSGSVARRLLQLLGRVGITRAASLAEAAEFVVESFGAFDFGGVSLKLPTDTFEGTLELVVGSRTVNLIEVGPAHTRGDVLVHLPAERVAFSGDILFIGSHPIMWEGPAANWVAACDRLLDLDVDVIIPGHGPVTNKAGVRETKAYWERLLDVSRRGVAAGASPEDVCAELLAHEFHGWSDASRVVVSVDTIYRDLAGDRSHRDPLTMLARMARLERTRTVGRQHA
jgi:glyoxylase-like metal-dependent hydrolase (beta-lactamase superfamily II)